MNCKNVKEKIFEMLDAGVSNKEIAEELGVCKDTVSRAKQEWKKGRTYSTEQKNNVSQYGQSQLLVDNARKLETLEPIVLNAIYRSERWQRVFFSDDSKISFQSDDLNNTRVFKFLKWVYNKEGYLPQQDFITAKWEAMWKRKNLDGQLSQEKMDEIDDIFNKTIWCLDGTDKFLEEMVMEYIGTIKCTDTVTAIMNYLKNNGTISDVKASCLNLGKSLDFTEERIVTMDSYAPMSKSRAFPFVVPQISEAAHGFNSGVSILCGCTGTGKTMMVCQQLIFLAKQGIRSIHFILGDLMLDEFQARLLANLSNGKYTYHQIHDYPSVQQQLVEANRDILSYIGVIRVKSGINIQQVIHKVENYRKDQAEQHIEPASFVTIDYDDLLDGSINEWEKAVEIYQPLQDHGKDNGICYLCVAQPTKAAEQEIRTQNKQLDLTSISGGKKKSNICDVAIGLSFHRNEDKDSHIHPVKVSLLKGRTGGWCDADVFFDGDHCCYILAETNTQMEKHDNDFNGFENEGLPF